MVANLFTNIFANRLACLLVERVHEHVCGMFTIFFYRIQTFYRLSSFSRAGLGLEVEFHIIKFFINRTRAKIEPQIFDTSRARDEIELKISRQVELEPSSLGVFDSIRLHFYYTENTFLFG